MLGCDDGNAEQESCLIHCGHPEVAAATASACPSPRSGSSPAYNQKAAQQRHGSTHLTLPRTLPARHRCQATTVRGRRAMTRRMTAMVRPVKQEAAKQARVSTGAASRQQQLSRAELLTMPPPGARSLVHCRLLVLHPTIATAIPGVACSCPQLLHAAHTTLGHGAGLTTQTSSPQPRTQTAPSIALFRPSIRPALTKLTRLLCRSASLLHLVSSSWSAELAGATCCGGCFLGGCRKGSSSSSWAKGRSSGGAMQRAMKACAAPSPTLANRSCQSASP